MGGSRPWLLLALAGACTVPEDAPATGPDDLATDTAGADGQHVDDGPLEVEPPDPELSAEEVGVALEEALAGGIPEPWQARWEYMARFEGREPGCPGMSGFNLMGNFEGCHTSRGWIYAGVSEYTGRDDPEDRTEPFALLGDGWIADPDGNRMIFGGELSWDVLDDGWEGAIQGTWSWPLSDAGWMQPDQGGGVLELAAAGGPDDWSALASGSIGGLTRPVSLVGTLARADLCDGEPHGVFRLRGAEGYWYTFTREEGGDCLCGEVRYAEDTVLGEACPSLASAWRDLAVVAP